MSTDYSLDNPQEEQQDSGPEVGLTDTVIRKGAALAATGSTKGQVQKALKLSAYMTRKLFSHELFRSTLAEIAEDAVSAAKNKTRNDIARMQSKAMKALEANLDKNSLEGVKVFLKAMGLAEEKDDGSENKGFTLMLATQPKPTNTITVKREGEDE